MGARRHWTPSTGFRSCPQEPIPNYVTPDGMAALESWAESLKKERYELEDHDESIVDASKLAHVLRDLRYVEGRIDHAVVVDMAEQAQDEVAFGARIVARDENGETHAWRIVSENQSDLDALLISWVSPLACALRGAQVGDVVTW